MWVHFTIGRGPDECQIACAGLLRLFIKDAAAAGLTAILLDEQTGPHGVLSALLALEGAGGEQFAGTWEGSVQWTCPSPLRNGKSSRSKTRSRKNWFISVSIIRPVAPQSVQMREADLQIQTYRASGPGGQNMQKTDSAIRVTHAPSGLTAQAQEERSQARNKALALARLTDALQARATATEQALERDIWSRHDHLKRGDPVRVYQGSGFRRTL